MKIKIILLLIAAIHVLKVAGQTSASLLKEGSQAPNLVPYQALKGTGIIEWTSHQFYLVEFGATWCKPCIEAIPELISLQRDFKDKLKLISVFVMEGDANKPGYIPRMLKYIEKRRDVNYDVVLDWPDGRVKTAWLDAARRNGIPQMFILDGQGKVVWIGTSVEKARRIIAGLVKGESVSSLIAEDMPQYPYDRSKLLLIDNNGGEQSSFIFRSILTWYDGKIRGNGVQFVFSLRTLPDSLVANDRDKLEIIGFPIERLYYMAYGDTLSQTPRSRILGVHEYPDTLKMPHTRSAYGLYWHNSILEVNDPTPFEFSWRNTRNRFNYSLKVPKGTGTAEFLQKTLQRDLATYFGYHAEVQIRMMPYWSVSVGDIEKVRSKLICEAQESDFIYRRVQSGFSLEQAIMQDVITQLGTTFGFGAHDYGKMPLQDQAAFIDETGINDRIDFIFNRDWTFDECRDYFESVGLVISKRHRNMKVVVIKDPLN